MSGHEMIANKQPDARSPSWPQHDMSRTIPNRQAAKHWTTGKDNKPILPTLKARGWSLSRWELDVRSEISVFIPKWHSLCIFPIAILCCTKCWDASTMRQHPRESFVSLPNRPGSKWTEKADARGRSWLQYRISSNICVPSQCDTLNTWLERLTETTKIHATSTDTTLFFCHAWESMSELKCLSSC